MGELGEKGGDAAHDGSNQETGGKDAKKIKDSFEYIPVAVFTVVSSRGNTAGNTLFIVFKSLH